MSAAAGQPSDKGQAIDVGSLSRAVVVGAGTMGRGIAQLLLQSGFSVHLVDSSEAATRDARRSLAELFDRLAAKGRLAATPDELTSRLTTGTDLEGGHDNGQATGRDVGPGAVSGAQWLFEAVPEDLELKRELFARAATAAPHAVMATNTSTLSVTAIAAGCERPSDVVGMHFFNPPGLMRLVEVVPGILTSASVVTAAVELTRRLDREPVVAKDSPGFIVNRLARPYYLQALRLHAAGVPVEQVDEVMRAAGFRQGPFELLDLIGLDVNLAASVGVYRAFYEEPRYRPHPLQQTMVTAGLLGRKTRRGFYRYDEGGRKVAENEATGLSITDGPAQAPRGGAAAPTIEVIGDNSAATTLRELLEGVPAEGHGTGASSPVVGPGSRGPDLVLDARPAPPPQEVARTLGAGATVAVLTWGRSASAAERELDASAYPGRLLGFSVVPGAPGQRPVIELMAPLRAERPGEQTGVRPTSTAMGSAAEALRAAGAEVAVIPDLAGGVAFTVVALLANEAIGAVAEGLAGCGEMDRAMRLGVNYPLGPLEWAERIGLRELHDALRSLHAETLDDRFAPHPYLTKLAAVGAQTVPAREVTDD